MAATLASLGSCVPKHIITNDRLPPSMLEQRARATRERRTMAQTTPPSSREAEIFFRRMAPYMDDPLRGTVQRRRLGTEHTMVDMEVVAIQDALRAAGLDLGSVDLILSSAFAPDALANDEICVGHAVFLARALGYRGAAWNVESACAVAPIALQQACALVDSGHYQTVVVSISCSYGRHCDPNDPIAASVGDAATTFIVRNDPAAPPCVAHVENTHDTIGAVSFESVPDSAHERTLRLRNRKGGSKLIWKTCVERAAPVFEAVLSKAGLRREDVDLFAFNTPLAWYAAFVREALDLPADAMANVHPRYGNVGPCLPGLGLHTLLGERPRSPATILMHSIGSASSAASIVFKQATVRTGAISEL